MDTEQTRKYIPYISVTHKVHKSCRCKMVTWAHDVYDVHKAYIYIYRERGDGVSPPTSQKCDYFPHLEKSPH